MNSNPCSKFREQLVDFADGELTAAESRRVEEHLDVCPECRAQLQLLERSLELAREAWEQAADETAGLPPLPTPETVPVNPPSRAAARTWRPIAAAVAASILVVGGSIAILIPRAMQDERPAGSLVGQRSTPPQSDQGEIEQLISLQARVARLRVSAELLASQAGLENEAARAQEYLAEVSSRIPNRP